uniref:Uncharacterized protein n=1 Tax=Rhizophora mucronata TaxID=61149 RepID=A0A2P2QCD3_RHIMU
MAFLPPLAFSFDISLFFITLASLILS